MPCSFKLSFLSTDPHLHESASCRFCSCKNCWTSVWELGVRSQKERASECIEISQVLRIPKIFHTFCLGPNGPRKPTCWGHPKLKNSSSLQKNLTEIDKCKRANSRHFAAASFQASFWLSNDVGEIKFRVTRAHKSMSVCKPPSPVILVKSNHTS